MRSVNGKTRQDKTRQDDDDDNVNNDDDNDDDTNFPDTFFLLKFPYSQIGPVSYSLSPE